MLVNSDAENNQDEGHEDKRLTSSELFLVSGFRQLSEEHRNDIIRFIDVLLSAQ